MMCNSGKKKLDKSRDILKDRVNTLFIKQAGRDTDVSDN